MCLSAWFFSSHDTVEYKHSDRDWSWIIYSNQNWSKRVKFPVGIVIGLRINLVIEVALGLGLS